MSDSDAAYCAALVREQDFVRYASTLFAPPDKRRALLALYAFSVEIERIPAQVSQPLPGEIRLQWWTDLLRGEASGGVEGHPVAAELLLAIRTEALPTGPLLRLLEARVFDLYDDPMPGTAAFDVYLDDTVGTVFGSAAQILAPPSEQVAHLSVHAGIALGIARLMARLATDPARRRVVVPTDLGGGEIDALRSHGRVHLDKARSLLGDADDGVRSAFLPLAVAKQQLDAQAQGVRDQSASRLRVLWTMWRAAKKKAW